jgi:hypothetical protein
MKALAHDAKDNGGAKAKEKMKLESKLTAPGAHMPAEM